MGDKNPKKRKHEEIETGEQAFKALDEISKHLNDPMVMEQSPNSGKIKIPKLFHENHKIVFYTAVGGVYMTCDNDHDISVPLTDDIESLIRSHERWELVARKLKEKCLELKRENELLAAMSVPVPSLPMFPTI